MRSSAILFMSLAMAVGAVCLAFASPGTRDAGSMVELERVAGAVTIANSRHDQALFSASAMRPGEGVSGTVTIGNAGDVAGSFAVRASGVVDTPGPLGGLLSERVRLVLFDVTDVHHPVTIFAGNPADFDAVSLGTFAAGAERDYLFSATLPDSGAGDHEYQGAGLSLGFEWLASPSASPTMPKPTKPKPTPVTPKPKPPVAVPVDLATALGLPPATACPRGGKLKFKVKAPDGAKPRSAVIAVKGKKKLRLKGKKIRRTVTLRGLRRTAKVKITVKASNRRTYTATRTYRACKK